MYGLTRGTMTLIGAGVAGLLLWLATQFRTESTGEYWAWLGFIAAAGLTIALSQLLGGWTKWGWPRVSGTVFLVGFLPALVAGGLVLLHAQPGSDSFGAGWAGDLGLGGLAEDMTAVLPVLAFGIGLVFGLTFDTTGPRRVARDDVVAAHESEELDRGYVGPVLPGDAPGRGTSVAEDADRGGLPQRDTTDSRAVDPDERLDEDELARAEPEQQRRNET